MNVTIFGADQASQIVTQVIENAYNPWLKSKLAESMNIVAYTVGGGLVDRFPSLGGKTVLNIGQFAALYNQKLIDKIILPREIYKGQTQILLQFQFFGVKIEDICITNRLRPDMFIPNFIEHYISSKYLPYLEFRIADHCNMNCKACAEFSGLVKKPHFPNLQQFTRDFERLRELIDDIGQIRILGGEPLLNPEINEYIKVSRRLYPQADIHVVTNALLLTKMPESFFDTLREYNAVVGISFYPPLKNSMPEIMNFLAAKNVPHILYHKEPLNKFFVNTILKPHNRERDMFLTCSAATCLNLWEGQLSVCYKPSAIKIFNEYFNQHLPEDSGLIDIWDKNLTVEKIHAQLSTSFELCRYCTPYMWRKWGRISYPAPISDWIND